MKKIIIFPIVLMILIIIYVFKYYSNMIETEDYIVEKKITQFSEDSSGYLFDPHSIQYTNYKFIITDTKNYRIMVLDTNFKKLLAFGNRGVGPEEFGVPFYSIFKNDKFYISDEMNYKINIFNQNGEFSNVVKTEKLYDISNFALTNSNTILIPNLVYSTNSIFKEYSIDGKLIGEYGKRIPFIDPKIEINKNIVLINTDAEDNIYTIFHTEPIIRKYNRDGELIWEKNVKNIKEIKRSYNFNKNYLKKDDYKYNIISLAIYSLVYKDKLYVVFSGNPEGHIYTFDKNTGKVVNKLNIVNNLFESKEPLYTHSICFFKENLIFLDRIKNALFICKREKYENKKY
ncbi:MAG: hypothetical protein JXQ65_05910 [Candidatus Marinimicrobia bacterium]|nr:hypothetical protein [Candidatus Neomarinimicrobiota bacterium]